MNDVLLQTVVNKLENQERKIQELLKSLHSQAEIIALIQELKNEMAAIRTGINTISFPDREMKELSANLVTGVQLLRKPIKNEMVHHHQVGIRIFFVIALVIGIIVTASGWYFSVQNANDYKASDTKYRYLKLLENQSLRRLLYQTDSINKVQSGLRDSVIAKEDEIKHKLEMLQLASDKEQEAKELRKKAKGK